MSDKTIRWKLFPFSLTGKAKHWYNRAVGSMQGDWEMLYFKFCLHFFPISKVASLRKEVLTFRQLEQESLIKSWECFNELITFGPDLGFSDPMLLQYFYLGLTKESKESLVLASGGAFLHLPITEAKSMLEKVVQAYSELSEEEKESSPEQEEEVLVAKTQSPQYQDLAINPKPSKPHNDDLDFQLAKMLVHRSDLLRRASWKSVLNFFFLLKDIKKNTWMACLVTL
jgi:hypothetical protein